MTSTTNPPHESGAFQFSLSLRGVFTRLCRPAMFFFKKEKKEPSLDSVPRKWGRGEPCAPTWDAQVSAGDRTAGGHGRSELRAVTFPLPAPRPTEPRGAWRPEGPRLPAYTQRKGHLPASPAAEQLWHTWTSRTRWPVSGAITRWRSGLPWNFSSTDLHDHGDQINCDLCTVGFFPPPHQLTLISWCRLDN